MFSVVCYIYICISRLIQILVLGYRLVCFVTYQVHHAPQKTKGPPNHFWFQAFADITSDVMD